ncbi:MAG: selenocysteine-specific translation elongation factor [Candidatus Dormiibacterota bacterium]
MQVIATAGHVDHGKSTLVRALTGMEPDRWAEERRRGMTIDLGYAWTALPSGEEIAFVDVPGHERFTTNMLAGAGPVPAVLLVIAADEGWAAQTGEHVRALDALGVRHGVVAVTRIDLADPSAAIAQAQEGLARTSLAGIPAVGVSGQTGAGLDRLRIALDDLVRGLPAADPEARVRLWVDRSFTVRGSGTVVTGTLSAGTLRRGDVLELGNSTVTVRALQRLGQPAEVVIAPARVAVNLRAISAGDVRRGDALLTPGAWLRTAVVDARVDGRDWPAHGVLHVGAAAVPARIRRLDTGGSPGTSWDASSPSSDSCVVRLILDTSLPLQVGDRVLLRDPGRRQVVGGATILDPLPPPLHRRGAARARAAALRGDRGTPEVAVELARRGAASRALLQQIGVPVGDPLPHGVVAAGSWLVTTARWEEWQRNLRAVIERQPAAILDAGATHADLVRALRLDDPTLLSALVRACPELVDAGGRVRKRGSAPSLRPDIEQAISRLVAGLNAEPFAAPEQPGLVALGLGHRELGAAAAARSILLLPGDIALLPSAPMLAAARLRGLAQPFTLSEARQALGTTRRVAVPLLEHLDRIGATERVDGERRRVRAIAAVGA